MKRTAEMPPSARSWPLGALLETVVRPTTPPLGLGIMVAFIFIGGETLLVHRLEQVGPESYGAIFLLGVLVVSAVWGFRLAIATSLASAVVYFYFHMEESLLIPDRPEAFVALLVFLPIALAANVLGRQARVRAVESEQRRREADVAARLAGALAEQQAALRRVATLVARGVSPSEIYPEAVVELSRGLAVQNVTLLRYAPEGAYVVVNARDESGEPIMPNGQYLSLEGDNIAALIHRDGRPARMDTYDGAKGPTAEHIRSLGMKSAVGVPIVVDTRLWGALIVGSAQFDALAPETEQRIGDFAYLVATAIANAETRAELTASRARIVTAADQARRRFERDLHDGAQQRVVSLGLELRGIESFVPPDQPVLREQLTGISAGLKEIAADLQEISRGIHPAILSRGGLGAGIKGLARRSAVPVQLDVDIDCRLPEHVEVAAYYVVAEALTNTAKHAHASQIDVRATIDTGELYLDISDDGVGGAAIGSGSGLIGLKDRVEALAGRLDIIDPPEGGTRMIATIPLSEAPPQPD
ncbi:DUF4118 domain-containing protein [Mycobacterium sp. 2YAF39]|uniref:sensor histidine kinase n=1 Tax=Mycobacterium sp. 2YAF39 TaxID=3233033 RepID=UPI003F9BED1B